MGEIRVIKEYQNPLLGRKEIEFEVTHVKASSPTRFEVKEKLSQMLNVKPESIYIIKMETKTNTWRTLGTAHIYNSEERAKLLLPKHIILRNLPKEEREKLKEKKSS
jgi:ribosomal protein S24E